jgi:hypothetical protein
MNVHNVDDFTEVEPFSLWLLNREHKDEPIAVALKKNKAAFATRDDAWVVDLKGPGSGLALSTLRIRTGIKMMSRNLARDLVGFTKLLAKSQGDRTLHQIFDQLNHQFVGDMFSAGVCINHEILDSRHFKRIENDVFDTALLLPQYEHAIAPYYQKVGLPMARYSAESALFGVGETTWWVTYHHLWLRVLAHITNDPSLLRAFLDGQDPIESAMISLDVEPSEAEVALIWQACGRDIDCYRARGFAVNRLPPNIEALNRALDLAYPTMSSMCEAMKKAYYDSRTVLSIYGRTLRPGKPLGEAVAFRVFGGVEELLAVEMVALMNNRPNPELMVKEFTGGPNASVNRIVGVGTKGLDTWDDLKELAGLGNPLTVQLQPQIVIV